MTTKYAIFVKEKNNKWFRLTKKEYLYPTKELAEQRMNEISWQTKKKLSIRKV